MGRLARLRGLAGPIRGSRPRTWANPGARAIGRGPTPVPMVEPELSETQPVVIIAGAIGFIDRRLLARLRGHCRLIELNRQAQAAQRWHADLGIECRSCDLFSLSDAEAPAGASHAYLPGPLDGAERPPEPGLVLGPRPDPGRQLRARPPSGAGPAGAARASRSTQVEEMRAGLRRMIPVASVGWIGVNDVAEMPATAAAGELQ